MTAEIVPCAHQLLYSITGPVPGCYDGMNEMCALSLLHPRDILKHLKLPEKEPEAYSDMNRLLPSTEDALNSAGATLLPRR